MFCTDFIQFVGDLFVAVPAIAKIDDFEEDQTSTKMVKLSWFYHPYFDRELKHLSPIKVRIDCKVNATVL